MQTHISSVPNIVLSYNVNDSLVLVKLLVLTIEEKYALVRRLLKKMAIPKVPKKTKQQKKKTSGTEWVTVDTSHASPTRVQLWSRQSFVLN